MKTFHVMALVIAAIPVATFAQSPSVAIPSQFASAHTMFLGCGGASVLGFRAKEGSTMLYRSAYRALTSAGHYQLTGSPENADISAVISINAGFTSVTNGNSYENGFVRLAVLDTKTHVLLWNVDEPMKGAFLKSSFQKNIDESVAKIVTDLNTLAAGKLP